MAMTTKPETPASRRSKSADAAKGRIGGGLLDPKMLWQSLPDAFKKLDPRVQIKNPVMFVVEVGAVLTPLHGHHQARPSSTGRSWSGCG